MYRAYKIALLLAVFLGFLSCGSKKAEEKQSVSVDVLPYPNKVLKRGGSISLSNNIWVIANVSDSLSSDLATYLVKRLSLITGQGAHITDLYSTRKHKQSIKIELDNNILSSGDESYTLDLTSSHIKIKGESARGIYYGMQTLLQVLNSGKSDSTYLLPKILIKDSPSYLVRGILMQQSQLNSLDVPELFDLLGGLKINSVYIIDDENPGIDVDEKANEHYINLYPTKDLPKNTTIVSFGSSSKELEDYYMTENIGGDSDGIVLDLTSTEKKEFSTKLAILTELAWSDSNNRDYLRINRLTKEHLTTK
jgi:hexosaminidase